MSQVYILSESVLVFMNIYLLISENVRNSIQACYSCGWIVLSCDSSSPLRSVWVGTGTCLSEWTFAATAGMTFSFHELTLLPVQVSVTWKAHVFIKSILAGKFKCWWWCGAADKLCIMTCSINILLWPAVLLYKVVASNRMH